LILSLKFNKIQSDVISEKNQFVWKNRKNTFSLIKVCLNVFKCLLFLIRRKQKESNMDKILEQCPEEIIFAENKTYDICRAVLRQRQKKRVESLDLFLSLLRGIILIKSLKLTRYFLWLVEILSYFFILGLIWIKFSCHFAVCCHHLSVYWRFCQRAKERERKKMSFEGLHLFVHKKVKKN